MTFKKSVFAALVAVGAVVMTADSSHAFFGFFRGSHGSWGGGSGGSHGSWGSHGGGWGSHGGGWGSHGGGWGSHGGGWGSHGGSSGSHGSHGGGYATYYGDGGYYARRGVVRDGAVYAARPSREVIATAPAVKTKLTLRVPSDAKVTLAGVETKQTGETRQFATTRLRSGETWDDYQVVVEMNQGGQIVREERTIKLTGGAAQELTINFDSNQVAQR